MSGLTSAEYERLTAVLLERLAALDPELMGAPSKHGSRCRVAGASGYTHQIDVVIRAATWLVIVECKCWTNPIGVGEVLTLQGRQVDLRGAFPALSLWISMVSQRPPTSGAQALATHFGISIDTITSFEEYSIRLRSQLGAGISDGGTIADDVSVNINGR